MNYQEFISRHEHIYSGQDSRGHRKAVFILHDQLNLDAWPGWVKQEKPLLIFIESNAKNRALPFHKKKLIYAISSMRHFALECAEAGFRVLYSFSKEHFGEALLNIMKDNPGLDLACMEPAEWHSREQLAKVQESQRNRVQIIPNGFFLANPEEYREKIREGWVMEYFYREMRRKTGYLMQGTKPEGGEWNYDEENRKSLPAGHEPPGIASTQPDEITREVINLIEEEYADHFGSAESFDYAVTRNEALYRLNEFIRERLDLFGPYEDAMATGKPDLYHSQLSMYLNNGLLLPGECCDKAQEAYDNGEVRINSVEGFIRQVIGWREYVRVYYEAMMPAVREANHFVFENDLPEMYWTGNSKMRCMSECLKPVLDKGYSHHIPRLMVFSNFSNLTETDPRQLNDWFHLAYVDAYEWVVLPNVLGMSTFADGGVLASKPYVSSGNYINKMSDYCKSCEYKISKKTGEDACPFNYLYWNFIDKQRETFTQNNRSNFMVNMFDKKSEENKKKIWESSERFLSTLDRG